MEEINVLNKGVYMLYEIKDDLVRNDSLKGRAEKLAEDERRYSKQLDTAKKKLASEINTTISKRRGEIESTFNSQLNSNRSRLKKEQSRRASAKNSKVTKRIENETEDLREEIRSHKEEIKSIFSRNGIPGILNNNFCFAIFMPNSLGDFGIMALTALVIILMPILIFLFLIPEGLQNGWFMAFLLVLFLGLFGCLYYFIRKYIYKQKKRELKEAVRFRSKIINLKRRISKKEKNIRKDSDESGYELGEFDEKINSIQQQIDSIVEEKKNALTVFENQTKRDISNEINSRYSPEIEEDERNLEKTINEKHSVEAELSELTIKISKQYETYLGKEVLSVNVVDSMINIMNDGNAETIADALDYYKKTVDKGLQTL